MGIDWSKYKGHDRGSNSQSNKEGFEDLCNKIEEIGGELIGDYYSNKIKTEMKIGDAIINSTPSDFKGRTYKSIINFEEQLKNNGDELIGFVGKDDNNGLIARIKTFDGGTTNINVNNYNPFNNSRKSFYNICKEKGYKVLTSYLGASEKIEMKIGDVIINSTPSDFKRRTYKSIINFEKQLKINGDELIRFIDYGSKVGLIAEIKTFDGGIVIISIHKHGSFNNSRKNFYNVCKEKGYKVLTPYLGAMEEILIDYNCGHNPNEVTAIDIVRGCGCPICKHKGESALGELLYEMFGKENVQSQQHYGDLKGVGGRSLRDDYLCTFGHIIIHFELNGKHHYEPVPYYTNDMTDKERKEAEKKAKKLFKDKQKHDKMKKDYCDNSDNELLLAINYRDGIIDVEKWERLIREFMIKEGLEEYLPNQTNLKEEEIA